LFRFFSISAEAFSTSFSFLVSVFSSIFDFIFLFSIFFIFLLFTAEKSSFWEFSWAFSKFFTSSFDSVFSSFVSRISIVELFVVQEEIFQLEIVTFDKLPEFVSESFLKQLKSQKKSKINKKILF